MNPVRNLSRSTRAPRLGSIEADCVVHQFGESLERGSADVELALDFARVDRVISPAAVPATLGVLLKYAFVPLNLVLLAIVYP